MRRSWNRPMTSRHYSLSFLFVLCLLLAVSAIGFFIVTRETHLVTAQLRVLVDQPLVQGTAHAGSTTMETEAEMASALGTYAELLRSRTILTAVLRRPDSAHIPFVEQCEDPIGLLASKLRVIIKPPGIIELTVQCREEESAAYQVIVNAVINTFMDEVITGEHTRQADRLATLKSISSELTDRISRQWSDLQQLADAVGVEPFADTEVAAATPSTANMSQKITEALAEEIARLEVAMIVDGNYERDNRQQTLKRLSEEYQKQTRQLREELESIPRSGLRPRRSMAVDMKKREIDRLQQQLDRVDASIFDAEIALESPARVQVVSTATVSRL